MKMTLFAIALSLIGPERSGPHKMHVPRLEISEGQQIVAIGDSITQAGGYLRAIDAVFAQQYPDLKIPPVINAGIGGQKAEDLVKRFEKDVVQKKPAIVTISIGINDVWHRLKDPHNPKVLSEYRANLERMVEMAQKANIKVFLLAPTVIQEDPKSEGNERLASYVEVGKGVAKEKHCAYIDLHDLFLKAIAKAATTQPEFKGNRFTSDGVHMKPLGDAIMASGILRGLGVPDEKMKQTDLSKAFPEK
jgi:acyl-CoA thioesterase-1